MIFECQSAFVLKRQITDNILIIYEIIHFLIRKRIRKHRFISLKLDMSNANDKVEWDYLEFTMSVLGFPSLKE